MAASTASFMDNKPLRNLVLLAAATALVLLAAIVAVVNDESSVRANFVPHSLFDGLATRLDRVDRIVYTSSRGMGGEEIVSLRRNEEGVWGVEPRGGYPANEELVRNVLLGMGNIEAYEPRTANAEWHRNLGLMKPEDIGTAVRIELFNGDERMAGLLVGKVPERAVDVKGEGLVYVRRDGEDQTWLARGRLPLHKGAFDWLDQTFVDIPREEVARVTLWAGTERPVVLERAAPDAADFTLANMPQGRVSRGAAVLNRSAEALLEAGFDDVAPADALDMPEDGPRVTVETFDGLMLTMHMGGQGGALWAKFAAEGESEEAALRAEDLNRRLSPWTYKLPQEVSGQLTQTIDVLTREAGPADAMFDQAE